MPSVTFWHDCSSWVPLFGMNFHLEVPLFGESRNRTVIPKHVSSVTPKRIHLLVTRVRYWCYRLRWWHGCVWVSIHTVLFYVRRCKCLQGDDFRGAGHRPNYWLAVFYWFELWFHWFSLSLSLCVCVCALRLSPFFLPFFFLPFFLSSLLTLSACLPFFILAVLSSFVLTLFSSVCPCCFLCSLLCLSSHTHTHIQWWKFRLPVLSQWHVRAPWVATIPVTFMYSHSHKSGSFSVFMPFFFILVFRFFFWKVRERKREHAHSFCLFLFHLVKPHTHTHTQSVFMLFSSFSFSFFFSERRDRERERERERERAQKRMYRRAAYAFGLRERR